MAAVREANPDLAQKDIMKKVAEMYRAQKAQVNPTVAPSKSMVKASQKLVDRSPTNALTKPVQSSKTSATKSATKSKTPTKSATKSKTATKSKSPQ